MSIEFWIGLLIGVALLFVPYFVKAMPWYVAIAGFALCISVAVWLGLPEAYRPPVLSCVLYTAALTAGIYGAGYHWTEDATAESERPLLDLRCANGVLPAVVPPSGSYNLLNIFHNGREFPTNIATLTPNAPPGAPLREQSLGMVEWATVCTITNYGTEPLFSIKIPVEISLLESVAEGNAIVSGKVLKAEKADIQIARIDAGPDHAYVLYIQVEPPNFARLNFGSKASTTTLARESREVGISQPDNPLVRVVPPIRETAVQRPQAVPVAAATAASRAPANQRSEPTSTTQPPRADLKQIEANRRGGVLRQLTQLYMISSDGISPRMAAGLELPPPDFLNTELAKLGEHWRVRTVNGPNAETYDVR